MDILEKTDFLFVNKEEAEEILYGKELNLAAKNDDYIKKLLYGLKSLGAKNVVITDGNNGSYSQNINNEIYHLEIVKVDIVEKTGAGDAYTAAFLAATLNSKPIAEAMNWGRLNAASVIQQSGAEEGLLTKQELEKRISNITID